MNKSCMGAASSDPWEIDMQEAEAAERADPPMVSTCREIVRTVVDYGVEKDDWKKTWKADAQVALSASRPPVLQGALLITFCPCYGLPHAK